MAVACDPLLPLASRVSVGENPGREGGLVSLESRNGFSAWGGDAAGWSDGFCPTSQACNYRGNPQLWPLGVGGKQISFHWAIGFHWLPLPCPPCIPTPKAKAWPGSHQRQAE